MEKIGEDWGVERRKSEWKKRERNEREREREREKEEEEKGRRSKFIGKKRKRWNMGG